MRLFCKHLDLEENRKHDDKNYPFGGYVFQCPKCGAYLGYSKEYNLYIKLSKKSFNEYVNLFNKMKGLM